jgi:hypothetical protein
VASDISDTGSAGQGVPKVRREQRVEDGYYIYGLVDPQALHDTSGDPLLSIFYIGKGRRSRWAEHEKEVRIALQREEILLERYSSKAERIRKILDRGQQVPALRLSAGYLDEQDAYCAEALAIDTVGAALAAASRPPLTNATPGHYAGFLWLREHFVFTEVVEEDLKAGLANQATGPAQTELLVKGTTDDLDMPDQRVSLAASLPAAVAALAHRVTALETLDDQIVASRRGWKPYDPWTDLEARERARRYWPIAPGRVASWIESPSTMPARLLLGIPEPGGRTVVRYAWRIDPAGSWEYYPQTNRWGIPLAERLRNHPRLGRALYETRTGHDGSSARVQVLLNYSSGIRVIDA